MKFISGVIPSPQDDRDYSVNVAAVSPAGFQAIFDPVKPKILNQGDVGSCVVHSFKTMFDRSLGADFSTEFPYGYRPEGRGHNVGVGMVPRAGLETLRIEGNALYADCPGNHEMPEAKRRIDSMLPGILAKAAPHKIESYARVYTLDEIRAARIAGLEVTFAWKWRDGNRVDDGIMFTGGEVSGLHEMTVNGWAGPYITVINSWGENWGDHGCFKVHEKSFLGDLVEAWAVKFPQAAPTPDVIRRTLRLKSPRMNGEDVALLQSKLITLGFDLGRWGADGDFGSATFNAVRRYQASRHLTVDGIVGRETFTALDAE